MKQQKYITIIVVCKNYYQINIDQHNRGKVLDRA